MITIFNRKELIITYSMEKQSKIRNLLAEHNIDYSISTLGNMMQSHDSNFSSFGIRVNPPTEYRIYVKKQDYEKAVHLLNDIR
ncbi:hypothetical protein CLNEO_19440 [Anaerotignum neopropionicum]|uniref:DUF2007 domain-containing protein n=1 Tax=Anaerotignum neopropionicum TaxID=36847 RepID=A0A136WDE1_9FIRM|nr:hypothetical protein [Anaerotignum neopropionicum]KXL52535.1 hypothetical protein CLNEO_19440 [Anaerotignum neopropionicum]